jgi:GDP-L-fucose synthase
MVTEFAFDQKVESKFDIKNKRIWITGHQGMLGSSVVRRLQKENCTLLLASRQELDLSNQQAVFDWVEKNRPELVFHIGAKVGGIHANSSLSAEFIYNNLMIQSNVLEAAHRVSVQKLIFVASNCTYPTNAPQPISEEMLLTGPLESNIRSYAVAKIAGIESCRAYRKQYGDNFISVIPPNLYGPGDNYHPQNSHVVAGILQRAYLAKINKTDLSVWGDGTARRELLYIDDLADGMVCLMTSNLDYDLYNIGSGYDFSIRDLATLIAEITGFEGNIIYDASKPNGTMRKLLDSSRINALGWAPKTDAKTGLSVSFKDFLQRITNSTVTVTV